MVNKVFLGLGSNVGDSAENLKEAIRQIVKDELNVLKNTSSLYETKPYGPVSQNNFLNVVIEISTEHSSSDLFSRVKEIEQNIGREASERWGPRCIDIDILLFGDEIISNDNIIVPHKDMLNRDFVMIPLLEIEPDIVHPGLQKKINDLVSSNLEKTIISKTEFSLL